MQYSGFMDLLALSRGTWKERFFNLAQKHKGFAYPYMVTICFRPIASKRFSIDREEGGKNAPNIQ
jgi:hypothetical protein